MDYKELSADDAAYIARGWAGLATAASECEELDRAAIYVLAQGFAGLAETFDGLAKKESAGPSVGLDRMGLAETLAGLSRKESTDA